MKKVEIKLQIDQLDELIATCKDLIEALQGKLCACPPKGRKAKKVATEPTEVATEPTPEPEAEPTPEPEAEPTPEPEAEPTPEPEAEKAVTIDDLREAMNARAGKPENRAKIIKIVCKYHPAGKIAEIDPAQLPAVLAEVLDVEA